MQVPSYGNRKVAPAPLSGQKLRPDENAMGGANVPVLREMRGLAGDMGKIAEEERQKADQTLLVEAVHQAHLAKNQMEAEGLQLKGADSVKHRDTLMGNFGGVLSKIEGGLGSPEQRQRFRAISNGLVESLDRTMRHHENQQMEIFDEVNTEGLLNDLSNDALKAASQGDFKAVDMFTGNAEATIEGRFHRKLGKRVPQEVVEGSKREYASNIILQSMDQMYKGGRDEEAQQFYDERKGKLVGKDIAAADQMVERGTTLNKARAAANQIFESSTSYDEMRQKANAYGDAKLAQYVRRYVDDRIELDDKSIKENETSLELRAIDLLVSHPKNTVEESIGPLMASSLTQEARDRLERRLEHIKRGEEGETDPLVLATIMGDPERLALMSDGELSKYVGAGIAKKHFPSLVAARNQARDRMNAWHTEVNKRAQVMNALGRSELFGFVEGDTLQKLAVKKTKANGEKLAIFQRIYDDVEDRIESRKDKTRPIGKQEFDEILNDVMLDETREVQAKERGGLSYGEWRKGGGWVWGEAKELDIVRQYGELTHKQRETASIPTGDVPPKFREQLFEDAQKQGLTGAMEREEWEAKMGNRIGQAYLVGRMWVKGPARDRQITLILSGK